MTPLKTNKNGFPPVCTKGRLKTEYPIKTTPIRFLKKTISTELMESLRIRVQAPTKAKLNDAMSMKIMPCRRF